MPQGQEIFEGEKRTLNVTATTQILTGIGKIARLLCVASTSLNITVYDNTAAVAGTEIWTGALAQGDIKVLQCPVLTGIRVVVNSGSGQVTVVWSGA